MRKRQEAFRVRDVDPIYTVIMGIMPRRYDAENTTMLDIGCEPMDNYIEKRKADGIRFNYMHLLIAAVVRCFAMRPKLNRFTAGVKAFERHKITVSFVVKRSLQDDAIDQLIKLNFNGNETVDEVRRMIDEGIAQTLEQEVEENSTNGAASIISKIPPFLMKGALRFLMFLDRRNKLPRAIRDASPFHCSFFITNLKSIKTEAINHHCYEFGTTTLFLAMGKEKVKPIVEKGEIVSKKIMKVGVSCDERICDGLYYGKSFHLISKFVRDPSLLETEYHDEKVDAEIAYDKKMAELEQAKLDKKLKKRVKSN